jgi:outer membrane protein insertion porin family
VEGSAEVILPLPFGDTRSFRPVVFFDFGNVFQTKCYDVSITCDDFDVNELRYSAGLAVTWITGLGPMSFALALPMNVGDLDDEETFQFELGRTL